MKKALAALMSLLLLCGAAGCGVAAVTPEGTGLQIYYEADPEKAAGGDILTTARVDWTEQAKRPADAQAREALRLLLEGVGDPDFTSPLPDGTQLLSCSVSGSTAVVDFSAAYGQLTGMQLTIADYCVTLTLTQITPIRMVRILADGREITYRHSSTLLAGDALLTTTTNGLPARASSSATRSSAAAYSSRENSPNEPSDVTSTPIVE